MSGFKRTGAVVLLCALLSAAACHRSVKSEKNTDQKASATEGALRIRVMVLPFLNHTPQGKGRLEEAMQNALEQGLDQYGAVILVPAQRLEEVRGIRGLPLVRDKVVQHATAVKVWEELGVQALVFGEVLGVDIKKAKPDAAKKQPLTPPADELVMRVYVQVVSTTTGESALNSVLQVERALTDVEKAANQPLVQLAYLEELTQTWMQVHRRAVVTSVDRLPWTGRILQVDSAGTQASILGGRASGLTVGQRLWVVDDGKGLRSKGQMEVVSFAGVDQSLAKTIGTVSLKTGDWVRAQKP